MGKMYNPLSRKAPSKLDLSRVGGRLSDIKPATKVRVGVSRKPGKMPKMKMGWKL